MAVILRYFTEFGEHAFQHNFVDLWRNLCTSLLYFVVRARCRRKESSRSLSHLLMSFLYTIGEKFRNSVASLGGGGPPGWYHPGWWHPNGSPIFAAEFIKNSDQLTKDQQEGGERMGAQHFLITVSLRRSELHFSFNLFSTLCKALCMSVFNKELLTYLLT